MKITALTFLSTLALASGFAPSQRMASRQFTSLNMSDEKVAGTVKWFDKTKGFGFILPDDGSGDVFVHHTEIKAEGFKCLAENEKVEFQIGDDNGRKRALSVTGPNGAAVEGK